MLSWSNNHAKLNANTPPDNILLRRSSLLNAMKEDCEDASKFSTWQGYGACRGKACSIWSFGCFMQQMQVLEDELAIPLSEMSRTSLSVQAFALKLLSLEEEPFPIDKSHTCKLDEFKYRISQRL
jgi:hypothetical protein